MYNSVSPSNPTHQHKRNILVNKGRKRSMWQISNKIQHGSAWLSLVRRLSITTLPVKMSVCYNSSASNIGVSRGKVRAEWRVLRWRARASAFSAITSRVYNAGCLSRFASHLQSCSIWSFLRLGYICVSFKEKRSALFVVFGVS